MNYTSGNNTDKLHTYSIIIYYTIFVIYGVIIAIIYSKAFVYFTNDSFN